MPPVVMRDVKGLVVGLKADIGNAAEQVGHGADYYQTMGDYARAARMSDAYQMLKKNAVPWMVKGAAGALGATGVYGAYRSHSDLLGGK